MRKNSKGKNKNRKWFLGVAALGLLFAGYVLLTKTPAPPPPPTAQQLAAMVPVGYPQVLPHPVEGYENCVACHNITEIAGHDRQGMLVCLQCHVGLE
ncbi:MAG: hypothetical protein KGZ41_05915 [Dethiobacter sp.]|nr:hypothetical protein [Dethiobacter sp.]